MKNLSEKSDFEHLWENAFSQAEMAPSDHVWDRIDASLSKEETGKYRKRVFMYKLLAAASVAFALGIGAFSLNYYLRTGTPAPTSDKTNSIELPNDKNSNTAPGNSSPSTQRNQDDESFALNSEKQELRNDFPVQTNNGKEKSLIPAIVSQQETTTVQAANSHESVKSRKTYFVRGLNPLGIETKTDLSLAAMWPEHIYMIPIMPRGASKNMRQSQDMNFIAGLDFSTGLFDPNFGQTGSPALTSNPAGFIALSGSAKFNDQLASFNTVNKDFQAVRESGKETTPEVSFSYGANVGVKVSRRIILQTGIAYRKSNSTSTSSAYIEDVSSGKRIPVVASYNYSLEGLSVVNSMNETSLTNQFEFASVPLRAGYMILDKKLNLTVLAGVSSEFYLGNNISGGGAFLESISESQGDNSPYKDVYFNGSVGTMLGYTIFGNYNITIEPGYRFAINSFTKDDFYLNSYPSAFNLALGVTYNFR